MELVINGEQVKNNISENEIEDLPILGLKYKDGKTILIKNDTEETET